MKKDFKGIATAVVTPINADGNVDIGLLVEHALSLLEQGCSFIAVFGTTGEGPSLSTKQKNDALEQLCKRGLAPHQLLPASMTPSVDEAAATISCAAALGCPRILTLPPFFYPASDQDGLAKFFVSAMDRAGHPDIGLVLYNIPAFSGVTFDAPLVSAIRQELGSSIVGIKDSTGDLSSGLSLVKNFPDLDIYTGDDRVLPDLVAAGGAGMIGGLPNLYTPRLIEIYAQSATGNPLHDAAVAKRIELIETYGGTAAIKAALAHQSANSAWNRVLPPLSSLSSHATEELIAALAATSRD